MDSEGCVKIIYDDITKLEHDNKSYKGLELSNKMKVLLISDPKAKKSCAAIDVNIGYFSDPLNKEGIASLCEHMLFTGSKKYPSKKDYFPFLAENGGKSYSTTDTDHTVFQFSVNSTMLKDALDRFSSFFIEPLFDEYDIPPQQKIIKSKFEKIKNDDIEQLKQFEMNFKKNANIARKILWNVTFRKGKTPAKLTDNDFTTIRSYLVSFYKDYYSANIMSLCVLGKESLNELQDMVINLFCKIPDKKVIIPSMQFKSSFHYIRFIVPLQKIRKMVMLFPLPNDKKIYWPKPAQYVSHYMEYEDMNTLKTFLRKKNWCNSFVVEVRRIVRDFDYFVIDMNLTLVGIKEYNNIIKTIFEYIQLIKENINMNNDYTYVMNIKKPLEFSPDSYVIENARLIQNYSLPSVPSKLFNTSENASIQELIDYLKPSNLDIRLIAEEFESIEDLSNFREMKYTSEEVTEETIQLWKPDENRSELEKTNFKLFENKYLPSTFNIKDFSEDDVTDTPMIVHDTKYVRAWYKNIVGFSLPEAIVFLRIVGPDICISPDTYILYELFLRYLNISCKWIINSAKTANIKVELTSYKNDIIITVQGYSEKQDLLLADILDQLLSLNASIESEKFHEIKKDYIKELEDINNEESDQIAKHYLNVILTEKLWSKEKLSFAIKYENAITFEDYKVFVLEFFKQMYIEFLVTGNMTGYDVVSIAKLLENKMESKLPNMLPFYTSQLVPRRQVRIDKDFVYQKTTRQINSCTIIYYQCKAQLMESYALLRILMEIIMDPYELNCTMDWHKITFEMAELNGMLGLKIIHQSDKETPEQMEDQIKSSLNQMSHCIHLMNMSSFVKLKDAIISTHVKGKHTPSEISEKKSMKSAYTMSSTLWKEILSRRYNFDHNYNVLNLIHAVTLQQFQKFFKYMFLFKPNKLTVYIKSKAKKYETMRYKADEKINIEDISSFKYKQFFNPLFERINKFSDLKSKISDYKKHSSKDLHSFIKVRYNNVEKSELDHRLYRGLVLDNNMKVILVNDPNVNKNKIAVDVNIGSAADPINLQGLANLCSRMIKSGLTLEPKNNLTNSQDTSVSVAYMDYTLFSFELESHLAKEVLNRVFECFKKPIFSSDIILTMTDQINKEFNKLSSNDIKRYGQFDKSTAIKDHPFTKFGMGNINTLRDTPEKLGIDVKAHLEEFYKMYYSPNIMTMCVIGRDSLDELEEAVVELFTSMRNKDFTAPMYDNPFDKDDHYRRIWYIVPFGDMKSLSLIFPISNELKNVTMPTHDQEYRESLLKNYQYEAVQFISYMLKKGEEVFPSLLTNQSKLNIESGKRDDFRGLDCFAINVSLVDEDTNYIYELVNIIFQYLRYFERQTNAEKEDQLITQMKQNYKNLQNELNDKFESHSGHSSINYTTIIARNMQKYPITHVLSAKYLLVDWNQNVLEAIRSLIDNLMPKNIRIHAISPQYASRVNSTEKWYGVKYIKEDIPEYMWQKWNKINQSIQNRISPNLSSFNVESEYPKLMSTQFARIWYVNEILWETASEDYMNFQIYNWHTRLSPMNNLLTRMIVDLLKNSFNEKENAKKLKNAKWNIMPNTHGIFVKLVNNSLSKDIMFSVFSVLSKLKCSDEKFEELKKKYRNITKNIGTEDKTEYYLKMLLTQDAWMKNDLLEALNDMTVSTLLDFKVEFTSKIFIEALLYCKRNTYRDFDSDIQSFDNEIKAHFPHAVPLEENYLMLHRDVLIKEGSHFALEVPSLSSDEQYTAIYFQLNTDLIESKVFLHIIKAIFNEYMKNHTMYGVIAKTAEVIKLNATQGLMIIFNWTMQNKPENLEIFIRLLISGQLNQDKFNSVFTNKEHFESVKHQITPIFSKPHTFQKEYDRLWNEIKSHRYNFDLIDSELAYIDELKFDKFSKLHKEFCTTATERSIVIRTVQCEPPCSLEDEMGTGFNSRKKGLNIKTSRSKEIIIQNIADFKNKQFLSALPKTSNKWNNIISKQRM